MNKICLAAATAAAAFLLSACSTGSKYYQHDGPPSSSAELDTSSATPRVEHFYPASLRPYTVMGQRYVPVTSDVKMDQTGIASWYGKQFHGNKTAIGETYNMHAMSAAHPTMPLPSYARITNLENGRSVIVRVNDRGPFLYNRVMDLSYAAATALDYANKGTARVRVERLTNQEIETAGKLREMTVTVAAKGGGAGRLFGSVTNQEIAAGTWQSGNGLTDPVTNSTQVQAPVQSATPSADAVVTAPAAGWSVQIGFFTERDNALAYAAHAEAVLASTSSARSARLVRDNGGYRVVLGNGMSLNEARAAALNVKDIIGSGAFAVQK